MQELISFVHTILPGAVFFLLAFIIVAMALGMVLSKNLVHSAVFMVLCFIGVSGISFYCWRISSPPCSCWSMSAPSRFCFHLWCDADEKGRYSPVNVPNRYRFSGVSFPFAFPACCPMFRCVPIFMCLISAKGPALSARQEI